MRIWKAPISCFLLELDALLQFRRYSSFHTYLKNLAVIWRYASVKMFLWKDMLRGFMAERLKYSHGVQDHAIQYFLSDKSKNMICYIFYILPKTIQVVGNLGLWVIWPPTHPRLWLFLDFLWWIPGSLIHKGNRRAVWSIVQLIVVDCSID